MSSSSRARLGRTIPALPARDVGASAEYLRARFGFSTLHEHSDFAVLERDDAVLHLWESGDESWRGRESFAEAPVCSGAESFLAGTASCRIEVDDVDALCDELRAQSVLHEASRAGPTTTDFGTRELSALDMDGNLIEFFRRM